MKNKDIVEYIKHYVERDISKGAIMLTGSWGIGKSYFIQNSLLKAMQCDNENKCAVISLYGLKSVDEISKSIYFELRAGFLNADKESVAAGILTAKTVVRGVTSFLGIDLRASKEDMLKLYESINLSDKLIVLEDLERCQINITEILGFVNNLVDQDGVKVLLVANENEFLSYEIVEVDETSVYGGKTKKESIKKPSKETEYYLKIKEKTVNDTIIFEGDFLEAIKNIINQFNNEYINVFVDDETINDIYSIMFLCGCYNLRSFIYACQKTADIFEKISEKYLKNKDFVKAIFYGNIIFVFRIKSGRELRWGDEKFFSIELGSNAAPLFKFCYEYIMYQVCDLTQIEDAYKAWKEKNKYDKYKSNADADINIISNYYIYPEEEIIKAINRLTERLKNPDDISFYMYGTIAVNLILIEHLLEYDITDAKKRLVDNLRGRGDKLQLEHIFGTVMPENETVEILNEYNLLKKEMSNSLRAGTLDIPDFFYLPKQTNDFCDYVHDHKEWLINNNSFMGSLDVMKMSKMFEDCSLKQKNKIRGVFLSIYRSAHITKGLRDDLDSIRTLRSYIAKSAETSRGDKVEKLQYEWFLSNLDEIIKLLQ